MILLEINTESSQTYYEILGLDQNKIQGMSDKEASNVTQRAARALKREFAKKSNHGDSEAEAMQAKINDALNIIKNPEERKKYDESLQSGENAGTEIFRIQKCAPPFFWDRNARYRAIEHLMRQEKLSEPLPF